MSQKVVICGAGFLGFNIAKALTTKPGTNFLRRVQISSRQPNEIHVSLKSVVDAKHLLPAVAVDITKPATLTASFQGADVVVSLVGIMHGTPKDFEDIQWRGAENVARAAKAAGAKLIHFSAIGADASSKIPYVRTKGLAETAVLDVCPNATIIRPSLVFGPGDEFFNRFARLSRFLPFMPVFGGGKSRFQPVYVGDVALCVEIVSRKDREVQRLVSGKIIEAGGPDILTYREIVQLVLQHTHRWRPIISVPFAVGTLQGAILEQLPVNLFTITRAQVEQLKFDNIVDPSRPSSNVAFKDLLQKHSGDSALLKSVHDILPTYL